MKSQKARNSEIEREIFRLVNKERKKRGLKEQKSEPYLIHAARKHSEDMIKRHYFSHEGKGGLKVRIEKSLYKYNQKRNKKLREHYKKTKPFLYKIREFFGYIPKRILINVSFKNLKNPTCLLAHVFCFFISFRSFFSS